MVNPIALEASWIPLTGLHCTYVSLRELTDEDWLACIVFPSLTPPATMETLAFQLLVTMQRNSRKHWPAYCWLPCNATILDWWAYPRNYCGYGCLATAASNQTRHNIYDFMGRVHEGTSTVWELLVNLRPYSVAIRDVGIMEWRSWWNWLMRSALD
jgi:hypothetical protein